MAVAMPDAAGRLCLSGCWWMGSAPGRWACTKGSASVEAVLRLVGGAPRIEPSFDNFSKLSSSSVVFLSATSSC